LVDFGLALEIESLDEYEGMIVGTPHYLPPEGWLGKTMDARGDLYSLGSIFYEMVTGRHPLDASNLNALMKKHLRSAPRPPHLVNPSVDENLSAIILKLLAKDPGSRYPDAKAFLADLDRYERKEDVRAMVESKRIIRCQVCDTLNPSNLANCKICGESLRKISLEMSQRAGEFECPRCEKTVESGRRQCPHCMAEFCRVCRQRLAVLKGCCELCG
jgi:serine/threonine protein kinase